MKRRQKFVFGTANVFADVGLANPEEHLLKAELVLRLHQLIKDRKLTQAAAGKLLGIGQPDLSKILRGHFEDVSIGRLLRFMTALGQDVEIVVAPKSKGRRPAAVTVRAA